MSYAKMMRWQKRHPKGTRQPVIMSTGSGFWPSKSYLEDSYFPYSEACKAAGVEALPCKMHYDLSLRNCALAQLSIAQQVAWTRDNPIQRPEIPSASQVDFSQS
jgi:hypothetical protein